MKPSGDSSVLHAELAQVGRIVCFASDPDLHLADLIAAIGASPHLASEVLRVANSSLYGMQGQIARLDRAALILGVRTVVEVATGVLVSSRLRALQLGPLTGADLWLHSLQVAVGSELVARALRIPLESEAYLAGLLHDMGIPLMWETYGEPYAALLGAAGERDLAELEREALGETHTDRLRQLAGHWGFPESIRAALAGHHDPARAADEPAPLISVVRAAHRLARGAESGWSDAPDGDAAALCEPLGLLADDVDDIRALMAERVKSAASAYG